MPICFIVDSIIIVLLSTLFSESLEFSNILFILSNFGINFFMSYFNYSESSYPLSTINPHSNFVLFNPSITLSNSIFVFSLSYASYSFLYSVSFNRISIYINLYSNILFSINKSVLLSIFPLLLLLPYKLYTFF